MERVSNLVDPSCHIFGGRAAKWQRRLVGIDLEQFRALAAFGVGRTAAAIGCGSE